MNLDAALARRGMELCHLNRGVRVNKASSEVGEPRFRSLATLRGYVERVGRTKVNGLPEDIQNSSWTISDYATASAGRSSTASLADAKWGTMGKLVYSMIESLDGYVADESGDFGWAEPDATVHSFANELERGVGTYLYGRRMYEVMAAWETLGDFGDPPPYIQEYANVWRAATKIVYSTTLEQVAGPRTSIESVFDPDAIRRMKDESVADISIGGPTLAAHAIRAGLVDEYQMFVAPVMVGGGTPTLPDGVRVDLELVESRRFDNGMVYLYYRSAS